MAVALSDHERRAVEIVLDGDPVVDDELVWGRGHVVRVRTGSGRAAIVKRPRTDQGDDGRRGYLHERVGLELLSAMPVSPAPQLLGASGDDGDAVEVLVMEELPPGPSVAHALLDDDRSAAEEAVVALARTLASVHAWSADREDRHRAIRRRLDLDPDVTQRWSALIDDERLASFRRAAEALGAQVHAAFEDDAAAVVAALQAPGWWRGYVHGDPCPDNTSLVAGRAHLFDYEHGAYGSVLLDASYLVAPFPTCWCFGRVPPDLSARAVDEYRRVLATARPEAADDDAWHAALSPALASWVLARGQVIERVAIEDGAWGTVGLRPRLVQWLDAFLAVPADPFPAVRATLADLRRRLDAAWPDALEAVPHYPSFKTPGDLVGPVACPPDWWT